MPAPLLPSAARLRFFSCCANLSNSLPCHTKGAGCHKAWVKRQSQLEATHIQRRLHCKAKGLAAGPQRNPTSLHQLTAAVLGWSPPSTGLAAAGCAAAATGEAAAPEGFGLLLFSVATCALAAGCGGAAAEQLPVPLAAATGAAACAPVTAAPAAAAGLAAGRPAATATGEEPAARAVGRSAAAGGSTAAPVAATAPAAAAALSPAAPSLRTTVNENRSSLSALWICRVSPASACDSRAGSGEITRLVAEKQQAVRCSRTWQAFP